MSHNKESVIHQYAYCGSGVKIPALVGVFWGKERLGLSEDEIRTAGTSGGSIIAACSAIGYTKEEAVEKVLSIDFKKFRDARFGIIEEGIDGVFKGGISDGKYFAECMQDVVGVKVNSNITFRQLHELKTKNGRPYKDLYIIGTEIYKQGNEIKARIKIYSHEHTPDDKVWKALEHSCRLPGLFEPIIKKVKVQDKDGKNRKIQILRVDGGVISNIPNEIFNYRKYVSDFDGKDGDQYIMNPETLAFRLVSPSDEYQSIEETDIFSLAKIYIEVAPFAAQYYHDQIEKSQIMEISNENVATDDLSITFSKKLELVRAGARDFFDGIEKRMSEQPKFKEYIEGKCGKFNKELFVAELDSYLKTLEQKYKQQEETFVERLGKDFSEPINSFVDMVKSEKQSLIPKKQKDSSCVLI
ncbi:MAG: patatin [Rickettsiaceae bacterium]|jgi:predicted acylesterase/phospholipase RssA|nr:patatin [Rickettsiaceae bacterium]